LLKIKSQSFYNLVKNKIDQKACNKKLKARLFENQDLLIHSELIIFRPEFDHAKSMPSFYW